MFAMSTSETSGRTEIFNRYVNPNGAWQVWVSDGITVNLLGSGTWGIGVPDAKSDAKSSTAN